MSSRAPSLRVRGGRRLRDRVAVGAAVAAIILGRRQQQLAHRRRRLLLSRNSVAGNEYVAWGLGARVLDRNGNEHRVRMNWQERVRRLDEVEFRKGYKVSKAIFADISAKIAPDCEGDEQKAVNSSGSPIPVELQLSAFLRYRSRAHYLDVCHHPCASTDFFIF